MSNYQYPAAPVPQPRRRRIWLHFVFYPLVAVAALMVGMVVGSDTYVSEPTVADVPETTTSQPAPTKQTPVVKTTPKPKKAPVKTWGPGTYEVGVDIKPGKYKSVDNGALCYWARLSSLEDEMSIKANHLGEGKSLVVVIRASDKAFKTSGCSPWVKVG